jgi:hypothetical protein
MRRTYLRIIAVMMFASLAAYGQAAVGQASGAQASAGQTPAPQASSAQVPSGSVSTGSVASGSVASEQGSLSQGSKGQVGGQSLGDIARQMREKQNAAAPAPPPAKVITNQDLGEGPEGRPDLQVAPRPASFNRGNAQQPGEQRAEQWRNQILEQKNRIANLQARIDRINASLHSGAQFEGAYSHDQALKVERVSQLQMDLDEQKRKLEGMQDAARRAGMPSQTYDP